MNNATLFFPYNDGDDLWDLYEERLFEDKKFFTSRAVVPSLFEKRFDKLLKREAAFRQLTKTKIPESKALDNDPIEINNIPEAYAHYQEQRAQVFQLIFAAQDAIVLIGLVRQLIDSFSEYTSLWTLNHAFDTSEVLISKDPEPLALSKAIQSFNEAGGKTIKDLDQLTFEGKETLFKEAKRLSLWRKKEIEDGNF